jgi:tRNA 2-(methylsulfanyl)-N6-isopentenyladenosine37 hydroxylase
MRVPVLANTSLRFIASHSASSDHEPALLHTNFNTLPLYHSVKNLTMPASPLHSPSSPDWLECVLEHFDQFLLDHAAAEKKAAGMALSMLSHYPNRTRLVTVMSELAVEEMVHFREVVKLIQERQLQLGADEKDPYVNEIRGWIRQGSDLYLLDRLLTGAVIEARGAERFALIGAALPAGPLKNFYRSLARSESRHFELFLELAREYFPAQQIEQRWEELLVAESACVARLPVRAALH